MLFAFPVLAGVADDPFGACSAVAVTAVKDFPSFDSSVAACLGSFDNLADVACRFAGVVEGSFDL